MVHDQTDLGINDHIENKNDTSINKTHPWRICPIGRHYVKAHPEHIPPGKEYPEGHIIIRRLTAPIIHRIKIYCLLMKFTL